MQCENLWLVSDRKGFSMTPEERDQEEARLAYLEDQDCCKGCLHDRDGCTHPHKPQWDWQRQHGRYVVCGLFIVDEAEKIAASAWEVWF